jgi:uncharacterized OB-fold protein
MNTADYNKPLPQPDSDSKRFWDGCKEHKLFIQKCSNCGTYRFPAKPMCFNCQSMDFGWEEVKGCGKIYNWVIVHYSPKEHGFSGDVPYAVVYVQLDGHKSMRMCGNLIDCKNEDIYPDMPVEVVFDDVTQEVTLPKWRPVKSSDK